jgi:ribonucleoside-triphosphate reductase
MLLNHNKIYYQVIDATKHNQLAVKYGVQQAPSLVIINNGEYEKISGIDAIRKYINLQRIAQ